VGKPAHPGVPPGHGGAGDDALKLAALWAAGNPISYAGRSQASLGFERDFTENTRLIGRDLTLAR